MTDKLVPNSMWGQISEIIVCVKIDLTKEESAMAVFTDEQKLQILTDLVAIRSVNDHETDVATYLQHLLGQHDIQAQRALE